MLWCECAVCPCIKKIFVEGYGILGTLETRKCHTPLEQAKVLLSLLVYFSAQLCLGLVDFLLCCIPALSSRYNFEGE